MTIPIFSIKSYIPEVIDGIFKSLDDPSQAVRDITISVLTELLGKLDPEFETEVFFKLKIINKYLLMFF